MVLSVSTSIRGEGGNAMLDELTARHLNAWLDTVHEADRHSAPSG